MLQLPGHIKWTLFCIFGPHVCVCVHGCAYQHVCVRVRIRVRVRVCVSAWEERFLISLRQGLNWCQSSSVLANLDSEEPAGIFARSHTHQHQVNAPEMF